jgi:hypothetical protein
VRNRFEVLQQPIVVESLARIPTTFDQVGLIAASRRETGPFRGMLFAS